MILRGQATVGRLFARNHALKRGYALSYGNIGDALTVLVIETVSYSSFIPFAPCYWARSEFGDNVLLTDSRQLEQIRAFSYQN